MKRIGIFAYNFEHKKTHEGLIKLFLHGYQPTCILAANKVKLNFYMSKIRELPSGLTYHHPKNIAKRLNIPYHVVDHKSEQCIKLINEYKLDLGIILGARILREDVINSFPIGILNMHPGLLPENRGLDNTKWAIINNIRQGVTTHLIDKYIDRGMLIDRKSIDVKHDDTLIDVFMRLQSLELNMMIDYLDKLYNDEEVNYKLLDKGNRYNSVPWELEKNLLKTFEEYKVKYKSIK
tara:strand:+ start:43 stop:750 length:708 start_codon:yes stop_codon:yes gene_type:complete